MKEGKASPCGNHQKNSPPPPCQGGKKRGKRVTYKVSVINCRRLQSAGQKERNGWLFPLLSTGISYGIENSKQIEQEKKKEKKNKEKEGRGTALIAHTCITAVAPTCPLSACLRRERECHVSADGGEEQSQEKQHKREQRVHPAGQVRAGGTHLHRKQRRKCHGERGAEQGTENGHNLCHIGKKDGEYATQPRQHHAEFHARLLRDLRAAATGHKHKRRQTAGEDAKDKGDGGAEAAH